MDGYPVRCPCILLAISTAATRQSGSYQRGLARVLGMLRPKVMSWDASPLGREGVVGVSEVSGYQTCGTVAAHPTDPAGDV